MKVGDDGATQRKPWYTTTRSDRQTLASTLEHAARSARDLTEDRSSWVATLTRLADGLTSLSAAVVAGVLFSSSAASQASWTTRFGLLTMALLATLMAVYFLLRQLGQITRLLLPEQSPTSALVTQSHPANVAPRNQRFKLGWQALRGLLTSGDQRKTVAAPEMVLQQFVLQVKAYAAEKSYQKAKAAPAQDRRPHQGLEPVDLLRRRWNEVLDSLNEFEIYLAGDQRAMIDKLVARHPSSLIDVSQIFRDVAESFDTTWRRKGINIESAIVTPLKATTSEPILRRILVGPWRTCAYLARRGNGVVFSAQSQDGRVVARWECDGLSVPEEYQQIALDTSRSVNERIEIGMEMMGADAQSSNTLFALVSLITWIDLAKAANIAFAFKNTNDGFVISLELK